MGATSLGQHDPGVKEVSIATTAMTGNRRRFVVADGHAAVADALSGHEPAVCDAWAG